MPQEQVLVFLKATGEPTLMHSVDAAEALRLGDYVSRPPGDTPPTPEEHAAARARAAGALAPLPPELMSPEQRDEARAEANRLEAARLTAAGQPVPVALQPFVVAAPARTATAPAPEGDHPQVRERHPAPGRSER